MKLKERFFLMCEAAVIGERNKINLFGIFDTFYSKDLPIVHPQVSFVASYHVQVPPTDKRISFVLEVKDPNGDDLIEGGLKYDNAYENTSLVVGVLFNMIGMKFTNWGDYEALVLANGKKVSSFKFKVQKVEE